MSSLLRETLTSVPHEWLHSATPCRKSSWPWTVTYDDSPSSWGSDVLAGRILERSIVGLLALRTPSQSLARAVGSKCRIPIPNCTRCMPQFSMSAALKGSIAAGQGTRFQGAAVNGRKAFHGHALTMATPRKQLCRGGALIVRAFEDEQEEPREWPYPKFVQGVNPFASVLLSKAH